MVKKLKNILLFPRVVDKFNHDIKNEYSKIKEYLPPGARSVLDIGSGLAGIDVLLSRHYDDKIDIFLIDKTGIDENIHYSFKERGSFYNHLDISKKLLIMNGVSEDKIRTQEATDDNIIEFDQKFDLVISLISWGFHYPVQTYLNGVYEKMNNGATLILDIRKRKGAEQLIKEKFGNYQIITEGKKRLKITTKKL